VRSLVLRSSWGLSGWVNGADRSSLFSVWGSVFRRGERKGRVHLSVPNDLLDEALRNLHSVAFGDVSDGVSVGVGGQVVVTTVSRSRGEDQQL
jgi:hypothetical protein